MQKELLLKIIDLASGIDESPSDDGGLSILQSAIGSHAIVRSRNEGINFGKVLEADQTGIVLEDARRIWYHKPKETSVSWYEGVAKTGLSSDSKISCAVSKKYIIEDYSITLCSESAIESIKKHPSHEQ